MMATAPVLSVVKEAPVIRKFDTADLSTHAQWVLPRMLQVFTHMDERMVATFLQNIVYSNEYLFLCNEEAVALCQLLSGNPLDPKVVVLERFVWVKDPTDVAMQKRAAEFYSCICRWAKGLSAQAIIVEENTDVPHDAIKEKLGRIFTRQQQFARV